MPSAPARARGRPKTLRTGVGGEEIEFGPRVEPGGVLVPERRRERGQLFPPGSERRPLREFLDALRDHMTVHQGA